MAKSKPFKMGDAKTSVLKFEEGHALHGLEIEMKTRVPLGVLFDWTSDRDEAAVGRMVKRIITWNLVDEDGEPAPISLDSLKEHFTMGEASLLMSAWVQAVTQPDPLTSAPSGASDT